MNSSLNYSITADVTAMSRAMLAVRGAMIRCERAMFHRSRAAKKRDGRRTQQARRRLKALASLWPVIDAETIGRVIHSWRNYSGPVVNVPRSLRPVLGERVGGVKWQQGRSGDWHYAAELARAAEEMAEVLT